jgi:hypothetical protein
MVLRDMGVPAPVIQRTKLTLIRVPAGRVPV